MALTNVPRWQTAILNAIRDNESSKVIQLSTIDSFTHHGTAIPHVRSHIFRRFLAPKSAQGLPLLLTSTDIRTPKAVQLLHNPAVELAWWVSETQEQFRLSGRAAIFAAPSQILHSSFARVLENTPTLSALKNEGFDWENLRREMFDAMGSHMRATWSRPPPGRPLKSADQPPNEWRETLPALGAATSEDEKRALEEAFANFAVLIVDPTEVDYVQLATTPHRRTLFRRRNNKWEEEEVVP